MSHLQTYRRISQFIFLTLLLLGIELFEYSFVNPSIMIATILIGAYYCGWVCPFGTIQEWVGKMGAKIWKKKLVIPRKLDLVLSVLRYLPLFFVILWLDDTLNARRALIRLSLGADILDISLLSLLLFLLLSFVVDRPFCHWLCPRGGSFGILSFARFFTIKRNPEVCIGCKKCNQICPMNIETSNTENVLDPRCINCLQCVSNCPLKEKKAITFAPRHWQTFFPLILLPIGFGIFSYFNQ